MNLAWSLIAGFVAAVVLLGTGIRIGMKLEENVTIQADLKRADRVLVRVQKETVIEKQVEVRWRDRKETIVVKDEEIKDEIPVLVRPDCVLPGDFIVQLHAISRNTTAEALGLVADSSEGADCRATLQILRQSYTNHYLDAAQLNAILDREKELEALDGKGDSS